MRILGGLFGIMMVLSAGSTAAVEARPAGPEESWDDRKVHRLVTQMTVEEKLSFVYWNYNLDDPLEKLWLPGVPRLGIPQLSGTDGPAGVTISRPAVAMPAPVALASTFDEDLARKYGEVLGREGRAARQDVILGPMVNNIRVPQAGRNFETFSEDPLLTGRIAASQVRGVQSQGLMTSVKHYAANTQETDRYTTDVDIDERTLREIELPGFEAPIRAGASSVMCAYPKVNGTFACSNETLLTSILREQWDFEGWVMSDWGAAHATEDIEAGLDQEMGVDVNPDGSLAPGKFFGDALGRAIEEGRIPESRLDTSVTRILTQMERFGLLDADPPARPERDVAGGVAVAQRVAEDGAVLLRNEDDVLPLDPDAQQDLAVIGPTAKEPKVTGLGSSYVEPDYANAPVDTIRERAQGADVSYEVGEELRGTPIGPDALQPAFEGGRLTPDAGGVLYEGTLTVPETGVYRLAVRMDGGNGGLVVDGAAPIGVGDVFGPLTSVPIRLEAGEHDLQLTGTAPPGGDPTVDVDLTWVTPDAAQQAQDAAVEAARDADVAVVFGYDDGAETADRTSLGLPGRQDELIAAVAAANPRTVVVLNTGSSITMPWLDSTQAVLDMWYPGQAGAEATTALLFGDAEPGGRLTQTFPRSVEETPVGADARRFPGVDGTVHYDEGIFSGYRWYDQQDVDPLFAFGHGLSYTTFRYGPLTVRPARDGGLVARVKVANTGDRAGSEVVQAYLGASPRVDLPQAERQLAGFEKVRLAAGESRWVTVRIEPRALQHWDVERDAWVTGTGRRTVEVGSSSRDLRRSAEVMVREKRR
ncbi:glycoside hydrolase family 3 C-terminal domain-containing protein [Aeromicrobium sp. REDSEA-S32_B7]|jgi:beta-glucosidase|uniref:beta-glucosidase family protein n=2 Tax=unclassified Aeromicrobium TaxID=2633570 RepID=UPI000A7FA2B2|nr:glycoside hydrolase family 3 C-terminal domain-containing protein [Aeromicrobium sp. REDSEA-S32_B7]